MDDLIKAAEAVLGDESEKPFMIGFPISNTITPYYIVYGRCLQDALDVLADYIEENNLEMLIADWDYSGDVIVAGNHGINLIMPYVKEVA